MAARSPEKLWKTIRDGWKPAANGFNMHAHRFELARKHSSADLLEVVERARAFITSSARPETPPDAEAAGYLLAIYWMHPGATALFQLLATYGAELVHDAVIVAHGLKMQNNTGQVLVREPREGTAYANDLRDVLRASDDARARCEAKAAAIFPTAPFWLKLTLAIAYPTRPEWAAEVGRAILADKTMRYPPVQAVFASLRDRDLVEPLLERRHPSLNGFDDLVRTFQNDVLAPLLGILDNPKDRGELKAVARALCAYESEEVARAFAKRLVKKEVREPAIPWFIRFPALAHAALDEIAKGKNKNAKYAQEILEQIGRTTTAEEASMDELPWILVHPPWIERQRTKKKPAKSLALALLPRTETVDIPHEDQLRIIQFAQNQLHANAPPMTEDEARAWQASLARGANMPIWVHEGKLVPEDLVIQAFNEGRPNLVTNRDLDPWIAIARFGVPALPGFVRYVRERFGSPYWANAIHGIDSARLASALLEHLENPTAWRWMTEHLDATFVAMIPAALEAGKKADAIGVKLRLFASMGHQEEILAVASEYGEEAHAAILELLHRDPRLDCPSKPPRLSETWRPATYHRPLLKNGKALPLAALDPIAHMLVFSELDAPYAGLKDVADACEPHSLAEFSWSLARSWEIAGAKARDVWMLESLAHFADEEVTRRTTPAIKDPRILRVLGTIGTDAAAMELATILARRQSSPYAGSASDVERQFERIAQRRGVSVDELEDRITPTEDLDADGGTTLDYGSRKLRVGFDTTLAPYVVSESGDRVRQLPPKRKTDDKKMVAAAQARWHDLKEDVATIAERRVRALERAMANGRSWTKEQFLDVWVRHPLLFHMAQGLVWASGDVRFRVAEDRSFAGVDERRVAFDSPVVVPHRLDLGAEADRWHQVFLDYEIIPPIDQLTRAVHLLSDEERNATSLERPIAAPIGYNFMYIALVRVGFPLQGWQGSVRYNRRPLGRTPGVMAQVDYVYVAGDVKTVTVRFLRGTSPVRLSEVHPVELSETLRSVGMLQPT